VTAPIPSPRTPALDELTAQAATAAARTRRDVRDHQAVGDGLAAIQRLRSMG
jgi:hypothetical protein